MTRPISRSRFAERDGLVMFAPLSKRQGRDELARLWQHDTVRAHCVLVGEHRCATGEFTASLGGNVWVREIRRWSGINGTGRRQPQGRRRRWGAGVQPLQVGSAVMFLIVTVALPSAST